MGFCSVCCVSGLRADEREGVCASNEQTQSLRGERRWLTRRHYASLCVSPRTWVIFSLSPGCLPQLAVSQVLSLHGSPCTGMEADWIGRKWERLTEEGNKQFFFFPCCYCYCFYMERFVTSEARVKCETVSWRGNSIMFVLTGSWAVCLFITFSRYLFQSESYLCFIMG